MALKAKPEEIQWPAKQPAELEDFKRLIEGINNNFDELFNLVGSSAAGGTGFSTYAVGDLLYADTTTSLARLADVATGNALISGGVSVAPSWGKIGLTTHITGVLPIANGGTGQITALLAFNALSPLTTLGDLLYHDGTNNVRLAGQTTTTRKFVRQTGTGVVSAAPVWDTLLAADVPASALTKIDDTNITLTLGGSPTIALLAATSLTLGWTGTLAAARLNANVVQGITNDTNITGSIAAQVLTLGWTGTLAAARLNANVVQGVTSDTNVTGSIVAQVLTLGWTSTLAIARGGTGQATAVLGFNALSPLTTLGDVIYHDGTNNVRLAGQITSTRKFLRQTGTGAVSAAPAWDTVVAADVPGSALTKTDDTNITLTLGGSPTTALLAAASITVGWAGTLAIARGGTAGTATPTLGGSAYGTGTAYAFTAAGTSGYLLVSQGAAAPIWQAPATAGAHAILSATHTDTVAAGVVRGDLMIGNLTPAWARVAKGASGTILQAGASDTAWSAFTLPASVTTGDIWYGSASNVVSALADVATGQVLKSGGVATAPLWGTINVAFLSDGSNVALLNAANAFTNTGINSFAGSVSIGTTSSTNALTISKSLAAGGPFLDLTFASGANTYYGGIGWISGTGVKGWAIEQNVTVGSDVLEFNRQGVNKGQWTTTGLGIGMVPTRVLDVTGTFGATGAVTLGSTLNVTGATQINNGLLVDAVTPNADNTYPSGASTARWSKVWSVLGDFSGAVTLGSTLGVTGAATLSSTLAVTGVSTLTGNVGVGMTPVRNLDVAGTFGATGAATLGSTLAVTSTSTLSDNVTIQKDQNAQTLLQLTNAAAGAAPAALVRIALGNAVLSTAGLLDAYHSTYSTSGLAIADSVRLESQRPGGLTLAATDAAGYIRFVTGGTTQQGRWHASGGLSVGDTTDPGATNFRVAGTSALVGQVTLSALLVTTLTSGSIPFIGGTGGLTQDNANLYWDGSNLRLGIKTATPGSTLDLQGSFGVKTTATSLGITLDITHNTIFGTAGAGGITITLPAASASTVGRIYYIFKVDAGVGAVTVNPNGTDTVNGSVVGKIIANQWNGCRVQGQSATNWIVTSFTGL